jgi:hypothetical protein
MYVLKLSPGIVNEWQVRCIADVIPQLADYAIKVGSKIMVDRETIDAIVADCEFMSDPKAIDSPASERWVYRAMLRQCEQVLAIGPVEVAEDLATQEA